MFPSLLRSTRSYLFHIRVTGVVGGGLPPGVVNCEGYDDSDKSSPSSDSSNVVKLSCFPFLEGLSRHSVTLLPKPRPRRLVVGVPVTIHRRSTHNYFANATNDVDRVAET